MSQIERINNKIKIIGHYGDPELHYLLSNVHQAIANAKFTDIILDFSECSHASPAAMLGTCVQMMRRRSGGCDIFLELPKDPKVRRLFINANWAYLIHPRQYDPSQFRGYTQIPATQYNNAEEQQLAVNHIV